MTRLTLGVDPGLTGAFALLDASGALIAADDLPVIRDGRLGWIDADALASRLLELKGAAELHATVERVHAMPRKDRRRHSARARRSAVCSPRCSSCGLESSW